MSKKYEIDMTQGSLTKNIVRFSIPLMLSGMLQLLYNAADVIVVGNFAGSDSLAAVGSTSSLFNLIVNLFIGLATGTSVIMSMFYGSRDYENVEKTVHTAISSSIIFGIFVCILGNVVAEPLLILMGTPPEVLPKASLYIRILFSGMPAQMIYNFGSAVLRSVGDTKRPLYFLTVSGIVNVLVNLLLVIVFHMDVAGVAYATILAQYISATLVVLCLIKSTTCYRLNIKRLKIHKDIMLRMLRVGLPAGIQGCLFSISNVLIQSSINLFGAAAMAGSSVASNVEGFVYTAMNSVYQAAITACGQNFGAKNLKRIKKSIVTCFAVVVAIGLSLTILFFIFKNFILRLYTSDAVVMEYATVKLIYVMMPYLMCGVMEVLAGAVRGLGYSILPTIVSLLGACGLRVVWIMTVFQAYKSLPVLYVAYPVSWSITALTHLVCIIFALKKTKKKFSEENLSCQK